MMYYKCIHVYPDTNSICISMNKNILQWRRESGTTGHRYCLDKNFVNIPKCASTNIEKQLENTIIDSKFTLIRDPVNRFFSCFKHATSFENLSFEETTEYFLGEKEINDNQIANAMMHFIPQTFFINCSKDICKDQIDIFTFAGIKKSKLAKKLDFDVVSNNNNVTTYDKKISEWYNNNQTFINNFYSQDIEMYNFYKSESDE